MNWLDRLATAVTESYSHAAKATNAALLDAALPEPKQGAEATFNFPTLASAVRNFGGSVGMPTNAKAFARALAGDQSPITAKDFQPAEIRAIQQLAELADDRKAVTYDTYDTIKPSLSEYTALTDQSVRMPDPLQQVMTTLGQFRAVPEQGGYRIVDMYNFNPLAEFRGAAPEGTPEILDTGGAVQYAKEAAAAGDTYDFFRFLGDAYGPRPGAGMPVNFVVPYPKRGGK